MTRLYLYFYEGSFVLDYESDFRGSSRLALQKLIGVPKCLITHFNEYEFWWYDSV